MENRGPSEDDGGFDRLSSEDLAALVVDALLDAGILRMSDVPRAIRIAAEEIDVRKTLGDYQVWCSDRIVMRPSYAKTRRASATRRSS
jgi:hypothetical protein